jgi:hypothetical protein
MGSIPQPANPRATMLQEIAFPCFQTIDENLLQGLQVIKISADSANMAEFATLYIIAKPFRKGRIGTAQVFISDGHQWPPVDAPGFTRPNLLFGAHHAREFIVRITPGNSSQFGASRKRKKDLVENDTSTLW